MRSKLAILSLPHATSLAVNDAGPRPQLGERLDDQREPVGEVVAGAAVELDTRAVLAGDHAEAVVLDLMQPLCAGRWCPDE
jgi:hypothetical protein